MQVRAGGKFGWNEAEQNETLKHVLLVAGGIGINPLYSIIQVIPDSLCNRTPCVLTSRTLAVPCSRSLLVGSALCVQPPVLVQLAASCSVALRAQALVAVPDAEVPNLSSISVVYTAKTMSELAYREDLEAIAEYDPRVKLFLRATHRTNAHGLEVLVSDVSDNGLDSEVRAGRVDLEGLAEVIERSGVPGSETTTFVCGPPIMTDHMVEMLEGSLGVKNVR